MRKVSFYFFAIFVPTKLKKLESKKVTIFEKRNNSKLIKNDMKCCYCERLINGDQQKIFYKSQLCAERVICSMELDAPCFIIDSDKK